MEFEYAVKFEDGNHGDRLVLSKENALTVYRGHRRHGRNVKLQVRLVTSWADREDDVPSHIEKEFKYVV